MKTGLKKMVIITACLIMLFGVVGIGVAPNNSIFGIFVIKADALTTTEKRTSGYIHYNKITVEGTYGDAFGQHYSYSYAVITGCDKNAKGKVTIPDSFGYDNVTSIYSGAFNDCTEVTEFVICDPSKITGAQFKGCTSLEKLTVPENNNTYYTSGNCLISDGKVLVGCKTSIIPDDGTISGIDNYAFYGCTELTSIAIPDIVTSIGDSAFSECTGLTSITIPNSVISIGKSAFYGCTGLTSITMSNGITNIGNSAFSGCTGLTSITIPNSVTSIDNYVFHNCTGLTSITMSNGITSIGISAFSGCTGLTSITIPNSVASIGNSAFYGCTGLTSIAMSNGITSIGISAFSGCTGLSSITIPNSVATIGNSAFYGCTGLTSITIPNSVTSIGDSAFSGCTGLTGITIPDSVTSIGEFAFSGCTGLTNLKVLAGNTVYHSAGNCIIETESKTLIAGCKNSIIPTDGSVTSIGDHAFDNCDGLKSITIPNSVITIGNSAFSNCDDLTSLIFSNGVTSIGNYAFNQCSRLTSVIIPDGVTSIGEYAFTNCKDVIVPDSITTVSEHAFGSGYSWNPVVFYSGNVSTSSWGAKIVYKYFGGDLAFTDSSKKEVAYCRKATERVSVPSDVTSISNNAFSGCTSLTTITLPAGISKIGENAFYNTAYYNNASNWSDNMLYIGNYLIKGLTDLAGNKSVKSGTTCIADYALSGCNKIITLTVPNSVNYIGSNAFGNVTNVAYTGTATGSPWGARCLNGFVDGNLVYKDSSKTKLAVCSGLATESIVIPSSTDTIGDNAFSTCSGITRVYIPVNVTRIGVGAFQGTALSDVYYEGGATEKLVLSIADNNTKVNNATWHYNSKVTDMPSNSSNPDNPTNPDNPNPPTPDIPEANVIKGNSADNKKTYDYRTTVTFTANVPEGGSVQWYVDGSPAGNGSTLTVKDKTNDYAVKVVVTDRNGNKTMDEEQVTIKHGFFDIIIWFFVHLFNPGAYDVKQ